MFRKRGIRTVAFLVLATLFCILASNIAFAGCCLDEDKWCLSVQDTCSNWVSQDCSQKAECMNTVCCLLSGPQQCTSIQGKNCPGQANQDTTNPTGSCTSPVQVPECVKGCCQQLTGGTITQCYENKFRIECQPPNLFLEGVCPSNCQGQIPTGTIMGIVKNTSGSVLPGVQIIYELNTTTTDSTGGYKISGAPAGTRFIKAIKDGYREVEQLITVIRDTTNYFNITMEPTRKGSLSGRVYDNSNNPVSGATVKDSLQRYYATTNASGHYIINNIPEGNYQFTALKAGYTPSTQTINILPKENTKDFVIVPEPVVCGDGKIGLGEQCDPGQPFTSERWGACIMPNKSNQCKIATSCALIGECAVFKFQCTNAGGVLINNNLGCDPGYGGGCCNKTVIPIPQCHISTTGNDDITLTDTTNSEGICECANSYYNTSVDHGFCCKETTEVYSQTPCLLGNFMGNVTNLNTGSPVGEATVTIYNANYKRSTASGKHSGEFSFLGVPIGNYNVNVTKPGFYPMTPSTITINQASLATAQYKLEPLEGCDAALSPITLSSSFQKGVKVIKLSWDNPCPKNTDHFEIYKDSSLIQSTTATLYDDKSIEWDKEYSYYVKAIPKGDIDSVSSNTIKVFSGNSICEGHTNPIDTDEFCTDVEINGVNIPMIRERCNNSNQVELIENCGFSRNPEADAPDTQARCIWTKTGAENKTACDFIEECSITGIGEGNIFGLFYSKNSCENNGSEPRFCAYDYSNYPVNTCKSCGSEIASCYDYLSKSACEENNCKVGNCKWIQNSQGLFSLGRGFCIDENYKGTEKCGLCGENEDIFLNYKCTGEVCSGLGLCYPNSEMTSCIKCEQFADARCEKYVDEDSCTGGVDFNINFCGDSGSGYSFTESKDPCGLKVCKWDKNTQKCYKDADDNDEKDCQAGDISCQKDKTPPNTELILPNYINTIPGTITFSKENGASSFYCVGNNCCPTTPVAEDKIVLPNDFFKLEGVTGLVNISYYSKDSNKNVERIKTSSVFVDTVKPEIDVGTILVEDDVSSSDKSRVTLTFTTSEPSTCSASVTELDATSPVETINNIRSDDKGVSKSFNSAFSDGTYVLDIECIDDYENSNTKSQTLKIDRVHMIRDIYPDGQTFDNTTRTNGIKFFWRTLDQLYCSYTRKYPAPSTETWASNNGFGIPDGDYYNYTAIENFNFNIPESEHLGLFKYDLKCYNTPQFSPSNLKDKAVLYFYFDIYAPITTLYYITGSFTSLFNESKYYDNNTILKFVCQDRNQDNKQSNCTEAKAYLCINNNCEEINMQKKTNADPIEYQVKISDLGIGSGTYKLCFSGVDSFNNKEKQKCVNLSVDIEAPVIDELITTPSLTNTSVVTVTGTFSEADLKYVSIIVKHYFENLSSPQIVFETIPPLTPGNGIDNYAKTFSTIVQLEPGENIVSALAEDNSGKLGRKETYAFYDKEGPVITGLVMNESFAVKNLNNKAEYGGKLLFSATAEDVHWTNVVKKVSVTIHYQNPDLFEPVTIELQRVNSTSNYIGEYSPVFIDGHYDMIVGNYTASFKAIDQFNNENTYNYSFAIDDKEALLFNLTILNSPRRDELGLQKVSYGSYQVKLTANKPIKEWKYFNYTVKKGTKVNNYPLRFYSSDPTNMTFIFNFTIFRNDDFSNISGNNSEFIIRAVDINGKEGTAQNIIEGRYFHTDTFGGSGPLIDPYVFDEEGYLFSKENTLTLIGFTQPYEGGLDVVLNMSGATNNIVTTTSAQKSNKLYDLVVYGNYNKGDTEIKVDGNYQNISTYWLEFQNNPRENRQRYKIESAVYNSLTDKTEIIITPALETQITDRLPCKVYDSVNPTGRFEFNVITNFGKTKLEIYAIDEFGNIGEKLVRYFVIDNTPPEFSEFYPENAMIVSGEPFVSVLVTDDSKVKKESITLKLIHNNQETLLKCTDMNCIQEERNFRVNYSLGDNGMYEATINATDMIGNSGSASWYFEYNQYVPRTPSIYLDPGIKHDIWYTRKKNPDFGIIFDYRENVTLTSLKIDDVEYEINNIQKINYYTWELTGATFTEGEHKATIEAYKILENGSQGPNGRWIYKFVVDSTPPLINTQEKLNVEDELVEISGEIVDEYPYKVKFAGDVIDGYGLINGFNFDGEVFVDEVMNGEDKVRNVIVKAEDKAGNVEEKNVIVNVSKKPPVVQVRWPSKITNNMFTEISGNCSGRFVEIRDSNSVLNSAYGGEFTLTIPLHKNYNTIYVICYENSNKAISDVYTIRVDDKAPVIRDYWPRFNSGGNRIWLKLYDDNLWDDSSAPQLNLTIDNIEVTPRVITEGDGYLYVSAPVANGVHQARIKIKDLAGNENEFAWQFIIDNLLPEDPAFSFENLHYFNTKYPYLGLTFKASTLIINAFLLDGQPVDYEISNCGDNCKIVSSVPRIKNDGLHKLTVIASSSPGKSVKYEREFYVDTEKPVIEITSKQYYNENKYIEGVVSDNNIAGVYVDGLNSLIDYESDKFEQSNFYNPGENPYYYILAEDKAGNMEERNILMISDSTPPELSINLPDASPIETITAVINSSEPVKLSIETPSGKSEMPTNTEFQQQLTLINGLNKITLTATDMAGNMRKITKYVYLDKSNPKILTLSPKTNNILGSGQYEISSIAKDDGKIEKMELYIDGNLMKTVYEENIITLPVNLEAGSHLIKVRAIDSSGRYAERTSNIQVTTSAPKLLSFNVENTYNTRSPHISLTFDRPVSVKAILDGVNITMTNSGGNTYTYTPPTLMCSICEFYFEAESSGGKAKINKQFIVDEEAPVIEKDFDADNVYVNEKVYVSGNVYDDYIDSIKVSGQKAMLYKEGGKTRYFAEVNASENIQIIAYDLAGNQAILEKPVIYDNIAPSITVSNIQSITLPYGVTKGDIVIVSGSFNDAHALFSDTSELGYNTFRSPVFLGKSFETSGRIITLSDRGGNIGAALVSAKRDISPPRIKVSPTISTSQQNVLITAETYEDSFCQMINIKDFNEKASNDNNPKIHTFTIPVETNLLNEYEIICTDNAINSNVVGLSIMKDTIKPKVLDSELLNGEKKNGGIENSSFLLAENMTTSIKIKANEEVRCKYGATTDYNNMQPFLGFNENIFSTTPSTNLFTLQDKRNYTYYVICEDRAGNRGNPYPIAIETDSVASVLIFDRRPLGYTGDRNPTISVRTYVPAKCDARTSALTGRKEMQRTYDDGTYLHKISAIPNLFSTLQHNRSYEVEVLCKDESNRRREGSVWIGFLTDYYVSAPLFISPPNNFATNNPTISVNVSAEPQSYITLKVNGLEQITRYTDTGMLSFDVTLFNGNNTITAYVTDKMNNKNYSSIKGIYESSGPVILYTIPYPKTIVNEISEVKAFVQKTALPVDYANSIAELRDSHGNPVSISRNDQGYFIVMRINEVLINGTYYARFIPRDVAGNYGQGFTTIFDIIPGAVKIELDEPQIGSIVANNRTIFKGRLLSYAPLKPESFKLSINNVVYLPEIDNIGNFNVVVTLSEGENRFVFVAEDELGNPGLLSGVVYYNKNGLSTLCLGFYCIP